MKPQLKAQIKAFEAHKHYARRHKQVAIALLSVMALAGVTAHIAPDPIPEPIWDGISAPTHLTSGYIDKLQKYAGADDLYLAVPPVAAITPFTTTASKFAGYGCVTFTARTSTLGVGNRNEHLVGWEITSAPSGWTQSWTDPRSGKTNGNTFDLGVAGTIMYGCENLALYCDKAGTYNIKLYYIDAQGAVSTAITSHVASAVGIEANIYCDIGLSTGLNDGTSKANAFQAYQAALNAFGASAAGTPTTLWLAGNQSGAHYQTGVSGTQLLTTEANRRYMTYNDSVEPPIEDVLNGSGISWAGENHTIKGVRYINTAGGFSAGTCIKMNTITGTATRRLENDIAILDCSTATGCNMESFIETTFNGDTRILMLRNNTSSGVWRVSGFFGSPDVAFIAGNILGSGGVGTSSTANYERPIRINTVRRDNALGTQDYSGLVNVSVFMNDIVSDIKEGVRIQGSDGVDVVANKITCSVEGCVWLGQNSGQTYRYGLETRILANELIQTSGFDIVSLKLYSTISANATIVIVGNKLTQTSTTGSGTAIDLTNTGTGTSGTIAECHILGNTIQSASTNANVSLVKGTGTAVMRCNNNIFDYTGTTTLSQWNDRMCSFASGTLTEINNNVWSGTGNVWSSDPSKVDGVGKTNAELNALATATGNIEQDITLDTNLLPTPSDTVNAVDTQLVDYYLGLLTIGGNSLIGAVSVVPADATAATSFSSLVRPKIARTRMSGSSNKSGSVAGGGGVGYQIGGPSDTLG